MAGRGPRGTDGASDLIRLGNECSARGDLAGAEAAFRRAAKVAPKNAAAHFNLANTLRKTGQQAEAIRSYRRAVAIDADVPQILNNLGEALLDVGEAGEAKELFARAVENGGNLGAGLALIHNNLGNAMRAGGDGAGAEAQFHRAIEIAPDYAPAMTNLGGALMAAGKFADAEACHRRAIAADADFSEAHYNLGVLLLLQGRTEEGWPEFEWRWRVAKGEQARGFPQAPWQGEDVAGKRVLVWSEQGVGDEILFAGLVPELLRLGADVVVECEPRLVPLFQRSFAGVRCVAKADPPDKSLSDADIDFQVAGAGLGRWLVPDLDAFRARSAYLAADRALTEALARRYREDGGALVCGIAWRSRNRDIGREKSMTLADLVPLAECDGIRFVDLQYGDTTDERREFEAATGVPVLRDEAVDQMADLDAFAAQVAALDLVVTVSNTTAHVAGAVGVPAFVMLNTVPLHCWGLERGGSPWYPSATLYRQVDAGEWSDVVERVAADVAGFTPGRDG